MRAEIDRYIREDLDTRPRDAATREADGTTVRNLWRLELHNDKLPHLWQAEDIRALVGPLVHGTPVLAAVETFNKPAKIGSGVPFTRTIRTSVRRRRTCSPCGLRLTRLPRRMGPCIS